MEVVVIIGTFKWISNRRPAWSLWSDLYLNVIPHSFAKMFQKIPEIKLPMKNVTQTPASFLLYSKNVQIQHVSYISFPVCLLQS